MTPSLAVFDRHFRQWVSADCNSSGYPPPSETFYQNVRERLTDETLAWIGYGIEAGLVQEDGSRFRLKGSPPGKGPYKWFSSRTDAVLPQCNWEYYVQVASFVRLWEPCSTAQLQLSFEDALMDLAVRRDDQVYWCIEVKESVRQLEPLVAKLVSYGAGGVDLKMPDRGNDALRKAKYLVMHEPKYFTGIAIGAEQNFQVHPKRNLVESAGDPGRSALRYFSLVEASPPIEMLGQPT